MKMKKLRTLLILAVAVVTVGVCAGIRLYRTVTQERAVDGKLTVHFIDVGQGDAALLTLPYGQTAMIDTGTSESADAVVAYLRRRGIERIDYLFLSHPHSDHAGGLEALCEAFEVGELCYAGVAPTLDGASTPVLHALLAGSTTEIGGVAFTVLAPVVLQEEENDNSMVLRLDYGEISFLFMGDAGQNEENALLEKGAELLDCDILKVAHHGSAGSTSEAFVRAVTPKVAIISASEDNSFGHPAPSVVARLEASGAQVLATYETGSIMLVCDGETVVRRTGDDYLVLPPDRAKRLSGQKYLRAQPAKFQKNTCICLINDV